MSAPVAIAIVSWNSAGDLEANLEAVLELDPPPCEIVVVDNSSSDGSATVAHQLLGARGSVLELDYNSGWAGGMNRAIAATSAPWILALNPDARPSRDYLARLLEAAEAPPWRVGAITGRLVRSGSPPTLDACGMRLTTSFRHLDRGSGEPDRGQYATAERVFGATGAASLFARVALDDAAIAPSEWIDEVFHSYREDAELAFRLRERGWEILYTPTARCEHRRAVTPRGRRRVDPVINRTSLRNRYLLRLAHQSRRNLLKTLPQTLSRDLLALLWVLFAERSSLGAYGELWRRRTELRRRAQRIRAHKLVEIDDWFGVDGRPL